VEASIKVQKDRLFQNELGPILTALRLEKNAVPPVEDVATF